jgi:protease I
MADETLKGLRVAILATDGFEQVELTEPRRALDQAGAETRVISPKAGGIRAWKFTDWGDEVRVDTPLDQAKPEDFDALLLPGGAGGAFTTPVVRLTITFFQMLSLGTIFTGPSSVRM